MPDMNVTYGEIQDAASQLSAGQTNIDQELSHLLNVVNTLIQNGFSTDAASGAFESAYQEFTTGAKNMIQGLTQMSEYLNKAAQVFQEADQDLARFLQK